jgi:hypothetical protein
MKLPSDANISCSYSETRNTNQIFALFLYFGFCTASFFIPDSVGFGESLCFAYTYAMVQVLEVSLFKGSLVFVSVCAFFASVMPTLQILQGLQNSYSVAVDNVYGELYMGKEIMLYVMHTKYHVNKPNTDRCRRDSIVSFLLFMWVIFDLLFWFSDTVAAYKTVFEKSMYIARFSPVFGLAMINL